MQDAADRAINMLEAMTSVRIEGAPVMGKAIANRYAATVPATGGSAVA